MREFDQDYHQVSRSNTKIDWFCFFFFWHQNRNLWSVSSQLQQLYEWSGQFFGRQKHPKWNCWPSTWNFGHVSVWWHFNSRIWSPFRSSFKVIQYLYVLKRKTFLITPKLLYGYLEDDLTSYSLMCVCVWVSVCLWGHSVGLGCWKCL